MLRLVALVMISVLLSMIMVSAISSSHFAEASSANVPNTLRHKYSNWVGNQVCGDELCPGNSYFKWNMKYRTHASPYDTYDHQALLKLSKHK